MKKRLLSMLLIACMVLSMLPMTALAAEADESAVELQSEEEVVLLSGEPNVTVKERTLARWNGGYDPKSLITKAAGVTTIDFVAGLDIVNESAPKVVVQLALPMLNDTQTFSMTIEGTTVTVSASLADLFGTGVYYGGTKLFDGLNLNLANLTVAQLKSIVDLNTGNPDVDAMLAQLSGDAFQTMINALEAVNTYASAYGIGVTPMISITEELGTIANVGAYLVGAIEEDGTLHVGVLVLHPDGELVELQWKVNDDNMIITKDKLATMDLGAEVKSGYDTAANDEILYAYVGMNMDTELVLTTDLKANNVPGLYLEVAMPLYWNNEMFYSMPLIRPIVLMPNYADVQFVDENGNKNMLREFAYDGAVKEMGVTINGGDPSAMPGTLRVRYIGIDGHGSLKGIRLDEYEGLKKIYKLYNDDEATEKPTESGVYLAIALYTENKDGELDRAGLALGVMVIEPQAPDFALEDAVYAYDPAQMRFADVKNPAGLDYFSIAIDRENNIGYVNLPADFWTHVDKLPTVKGIDFAQAIKDFYEEMNEDDGVYDIEFQTIKDTAATTLGAIANAELTDEIIMPLADQAMTKIGDELDKILEDKADEAYQLVLTKLESSGKVPTALIPILAKAVSVEGGRLNIVDEAVVTGKLQSIASGIGEGAIDGQIKTMIAELVHAVYSYNVYDGITLENLEDKVNDVLNTLTTELTVDTAEKLVKVVLGVASKVIDIEDVKTVLNTLYQKVLEQGYLDYLDNMIATLDGIYDIEIDNLRTAVLGLKTPLINIKNKLVNNEDINRDDIKAFETHLDGAIIPEIVKVINQLPEDGMFIFEKNPTEIGEYDCVAINISANYYPVIAQAKLTIGPASTPICTHDGTLALQETVTATCTEIGYELYVCEKCGGTVKKNIEEALGHDTVNHEAKAPTCTEIGWDAYETCSRCDHTTYVEKAALNHDIVNHEAKAPTCTEIGWDAYETCSRCDHTTYVEKAALDHDYEYETSADGKHRMVCKNDSTHVTDWEDHIYNESGKCVCGATKQVVSECDHACNTFVQFNWSEDFETATVTLECKCGEHTAEVDAKVEKDIIPATCTNVGKIIYTATYELGDETATEIKEIPIDKNAHYTGCPHDKKSSEKVWTNADYARYANIQYSDLAGFDWADTSIGYVSKHGLMNGIGGGKFGPELTTTRGMIVTILYRLEGEPRVKTDCPFEDVAANKYYEDPITWAAANGIVTGYDADTFGPDDYITREQMAAILYRYANYKGYDTDARAKLTKYTDADKISAYAVDAMSWAVAEGLINGMTDTTLVPQGNAVRAQVAAILHRFCVNVAKED